MKEKHLPTNDGGYGSKRCVEWCLLLLLLVFFFFFVPTCESSIGSDHSFGPKGRVGGDSEAMATLPGGVRDSGCERSQNSLEIEALARFAVDEHNKKENSLKELSRVVNAKEQVVAGTLHHLTLEVIEGGEKKLYEAKVWIKPWLDFKELQEFKFVGDQPAPVFTAADLGAKRSEL